MDKPGAAPPSANEAPTPPQLPEAKAFAGLKVAQLQLKAARQHRESASALELAATALDESMARARENLQELAKAHALAKAEAKSMRGKADRLAMRAAAAAVQSLDGASASAAARFVEIDLAAIKHYNAPGREAWASGDAFELVAQPENPVDVNAIVVMREGAQVGFVSKESAAEIAKLARSEGWKLAGPAFLKSRKGGKWNEGVIHARLENPLLGWRGYNPAKSMGDNLAAMEAIILGSQAPIGAATPSKRSASL